MITKQFKVKGFTLIEMLVVIAIIGILAGLLIPAASKARREAAVRKAQTTIAALETALSMYYTDYGMYPPSANSTSGSTTQENGNSFVVNINTGLNLVGALSSTTKGGPYMKFRSEDLRKDTSTPPRYVIVDPWGRAYVYISRRYINTASGAVGNVDDTYGPWWPNTTNRTQNTYNIYSFGPDGTTETTGGTDVTDTTSTSAFNSQYCGDSDTNDGTGYERNDDDINNW